MMENIFTLLIDGENHIPDEVEINNKHEVLLIFNENSFELYYKTLNAKKLSIQNSTKNQRNWDISQGAKSMGYVIRIK